MGLTTSNIRILAIESSCDDTAASVIIDNKICSNIVAGQWVHQKYGGVVPELASRNHQQHIVAVVQEALVKAETRPEQLSAVAFTKGPGLLGSLMVGSSFAKSLALALNIPLLGVNHLQAHVFAHFIEEPFPQFPFMCLLVSGGHTQLILVQSDFSMKIVGKTLDDAAGEAFDKCAKILGLPYPGGPELDKLAAQGDPKKFKFPQSTVEGLDFSYSGLKTSVLYFVRDQLKHDPEFVQNNLSDLCAAIQHNIVSSLLMKLEKACREFGIVHAGIAGGVSANSALRKRLQDWGLKQRIQTYVPDFAYCTDNAAMIARAASHLYEQGIFEPLSTAPAARLIENQ